MLVQKISDSLSLAKVDPSSAQACLNLLSHINLLLWEYRLENEPILYNVSFQTNGQYWKSIGNISDQEIVLRNRLENKPNLYTST